MFTCNCGIVLHISGPQTIMEVPPHSELLGNSLPVFLFLYWHVLLNQALPESFHHLRDNSGNGMLYESEKIYWMYFIQIKCKLDIKP